MSHVKYIPSGFFGMLFDWYEQGVRIRLFSPQPNVARMLWFNRFFETVSEGCHELRADTQSPEKDYMSANTVSSDWEHKKRGVSVATAGKR